MVRISKFLSYGGNMGLLEQIEDIWLKGAESKAAGWAMQIRDAKPKLIKAGKMFRERSSLQVYLSYTRATKSQIPFSLRYLGQEVAILIVDTDENDVSLQIGKKTSITNFEDFKVDLCGTYKWGGPEASGFRKHFQNLPPKSVKGRIEEHRIEADFLREMASGTSGKFAGTFRNIQPVLLADCPFQFPLPVSGDTGIPEYTNGNIDILARRGTGKGTKISIWELKKPKVTAHAIDQAYIYAVTLLKMLRTPVTGDIWYQDIIGFGGPVPDRITIEVVTAVSIVTKHHRSRFEEKIKAFKNENCLEIGANKDQIDFFVAHYQTDPLIVDFRSF